MNLDDHRPDPDELLRHIQTEEDKHKRGKLKIFLGYAAGVGKTYAMLEAAQQRKSEGVDVVIGLVETHQRAETAALLAELEIIPRQQIHYRGVILEEMDLDGVLTRHPQLALVDELAHTNAPGARHPKRFQDVEELLEAGIDVYTTLNIQHLESLNDVVAQITGVIVHETLPDSIIDLAEQIELIDLPPEELIQRLQEGKIYIPENVSRALQKFFRQGNLTALREIALRRTARRVDDQMTAYMQTRAISGPWAAGEKLLVSVSPSPLSEKLIRTACRLAQEFDAEWFALYIETPAHAALDDTHRDQVKRNLQLAEELGAQVLTLPGRYVPETLLDYARRHNITQIVVGKPMHPRWRELVFGSVVDRIIRLSGDIDVYVINSSSETPITPEPLLQTHTPWQAYFPVLVLVGATTIWNLAVASFLSITNLVMFYLLAVVIAAVRLGRGPAILTTILSVVAFDFFFVPPRLTFSVSDAEYFLTFGTLLIVGIVIATLATRLRDQAQIAQPEKPKPKPCMD